MACMGKNRFHHVQLVWIVCITFLVTGCSGIDVLDTLIPSSGYTQHKDVPYGHGDRQKLDIYVPENIHGPVPVIVFFHGGSWKNGSKDQYRFVGQAFASRGYVAVIANYGLYPETYYPGFMEDSAAAFVWVHRHIREYSGDAGRIFLTGHSAGAYNAVMLTVNDRFIRDAGGKRSWIRGTIGIAGPYDFLPMTDPDVIAVFSKEKDTLTQPITFVGPKLPPMLLLTGDADKDVLPRNSLHLADKLRRHHNQVTLKIYPEVAHIGIALSLAEGFRYKAPVLNDIEQFIRAN